MRTSKIEKEINQIIIDDSDVPESILDSVKSVMKKDKIHKISTFCLPFPIKYIRMMKVAIIILMMVLLPITGVGVYYTVNNWYGKSNTTYYEDLNKTEIESIEWYNQTFNTNYHWLEDLPVTASYSLSNDKNEVLILEEQYNYNSHLVTLYVHNESEPVVFQKLEGQDGHIFLNKIRVCFIYHDFSRTMLYFTYMDITYYLKFDYKVTNIEDTLIELFKNQSIFD